jgi:hypothetical protein
LDAANRKSYPGSGTTWTDLSGRGNNGTLVNGVGYNGSNLGSLSFDGSNDYVDCGNNSTTSIVDNLTISIWIKFPTGYGNSSWNSILAKRPSGGSANYGINYNPATNLFQWYYLGNGGGVLSVPLTSNFSENTWVNICGVFSKNLTTTDALLYKNSGLLTSSNLTGNVPAVTSKLTIGCYGDSSFAEFSPVTISSVSIYNRALSASEIQQNFNALRGRFGI